jgi:hypothetical protein
VHSSWKLKAKHDDRRIEVEAEIDSNVVGRSWAWRLADNGVRVAAGTATTKAPSGSFTVHRFIADRAGVDRITLLATNAGTGEHCAAAVTLA